jgi:hypothetical protein
MNITKQIVLVVALINAVGVAIASPNDENLIRNAPEFTLDGKSHNHVLPPAEKAFWSVYASSNAPAIFTSLITDSTPAGQAYCLFGIYYLDYDHYQELSKEYNMKTNRFNVSSGDYGTAYDLVLFVKLLEKKSFAGIFERRKEAIGQPTNAPYSSPAVGLNR